jgi:hypothetical protein
MGFGLLTGFVGLINFYVRSAAVTAALETSIPALVLSCVAELIEMIIRLMCTV